ncbi:MAG: UPF0175 family protein [Planctomycetes bacterium]|nr:UPF0175 family protein [Planctomycetota bacterium]MBM4080280.1 UPF0175 family protein [Planctomycetota bacterium]MBM4085558.1 UPF0175 family protein [Planctomycetota bacterium]
MADVVLHLPTEVAEDEARLYLAMKLFEVGRLSMGQAAALAGYSKRAFMEILGHHRVPVFDYPAEEMAQELKNSSGRGMTRQFSRCG